MVFVSLCVRLRVHVCDVDSVGFFFFVCGFLYVWLESCREQTGLKKRWSKKCSRQYCQEQRVLSSENPNLVFLGSQDGLCTFQL